MGHHSTSDDSSAYRSKKEVEDRNRNDNPIVRLRKYLEHQGWWDDKQDAAHKKEARVNVLKAFNKAETRKKPPVEYLFTDVYDELPAHLKEQKQQLEELMKKYPDHYSTEGYAFAPANVKDMK